MNSKVKTNVTKVRLGTLNSLEISALTQYDKGQIIEFVDDFADGTEVQFATTGATETINKIIENNMVKIPDVYLESTTTIIAWVKVIKTNSETTVKEIRIPITPRTKPAGYIASEDEQTFREQMQEIMEATEQIAQSVRDDADEGKFNGEDGADGKDGLNGKDGKDGYTPQKGVDYFDGEKGEQGEPGKQGIQGEKGEDGKDYVLTDEDKQEIAALNIDDSNTNSEKKTWSAKKLFTEISTCVKNSTFGEILKKIYTKDETDTKLKDYVKFTDTAKNDGTAGVVKVNNGVYGIKNMESGIIGIISANDSEIETQDSKFRTITPSNLKKAVETIIKPWRLLHTYTANAEEPNSGFTLTNLQDENIKEWLILFDRCVVSGTCSAIVGFRFNNYMTSANNKEHRVSLTNYVNGKVEFSKISDNAYTSEHKVYRSASDVYFNVSPKMGICNYVDFEKDIYSNVLGTLSLVLNSGQTFNSGNIYVYVR